MSNFLYEYWNVPVVYVSPAGAAMYCYTVYCHKVPPVHFNCGFCTLFVVKDFD